MRVSSTEEDYLTMRTSNSFGLSVLVGPNRVRTDRFRLRVRKGVAVLPFHPLVRFSAISDLNRQRQRTLQKRLTQLYGPAVCCKPNVSDGGGWSCASVSGP